MAAKRSKRAFMGVALAFAAAAFADHVPVVLEDAKLLPSDGAAEDYFGGTAAADGDTIVIGAEQDDDLGEFSGAAYVFAENELGGWSETAKILASDGASEDFFGSSVSLDSTTMVVGALGDDDLGEASGSTYVFERSEAGLWIETTKLLPSDGMAGDTFGDTVALSGTTLVVGSEHADPLGDGSGAAYVFDRREFGAWDETARLVASDGEARDAFGGQVAISADLIAVGARGVDGRGSSSGAVYVFERAQGGDWLEIAKLVPADGEEGDIFGAWVAIDGEIVAGGAPGDSDQALGAGAAYVFERQANGAWLEAAKLYSPHPDFLDSFGKVAIQGHDLVVGTDAGESRPGLRSGTADLFRRDQTGTWVNVARLLPSDPGQLDQYGLGVAIDGGTVVVGARLDDDLGLDSGSAYVFSIEDCLLRVELAPRAVPAGTPLRVGLHLEHNRPETVTVPFRLWIEDPSGKVVASRTTDPITFHHGDTLHRELTLPIPADAPPGEYRLLVGVERMRQGMVARVERFRVVGAGTVAPVP